MIKSAKAKNDLPPEASIPHGAASLESILCTEELRLRLFRPPDYETEKTQKRGVAERLTVRRRVVTTSGSAVASSAGIDQWPVTVRP
jgi:hypothetical protein